MYQPGNLPDELSSTPVGIYLQQELLRIQQELGAQKPLLSLSMVYKYPDKYRDGTIILADGVTLNPGSGPGYYGYRANAWRFLG